MSKSLAEMMEDGPALSADADPVETTVDDLERILALPRRKPFDCTWDPVAKSYPPETQALVEIVTERYSRGPRVSCACRPRRVARPGEGSSIQITRILLDRPDDVPPDPPIATTIEAFTTDCRTNPDEVVWAKRVAALRPGEEVALPAADRTEGGHPCIKVFNAVQAWTLWEVPQVGGGLGFCGCGSGKTISYILLPLAFPDCRLAVVLIEPKQRGHYKEHYLLLREHFRVPSCVFDDNEGYIVDGAPPLHVMPYSKLAGATDALDSRAPNVLLADEAHRVTNSSAQTNRVRRYQRRAIREREARMAAGLPVSRRACYFFPGSGTLEDKSVENTQAISAFALGTGSPVPLDEKVAKQWGRVVDPIANPDRKSATAHRLSQAFGDGAILDHSIAAMLLSAPEEKIREGFCKHRLWTPGVISSSAQSIRASIYFEERKAPPIPPAVCEALARIRNDSIGPDGNLIDDDDQAIKSEMTCEIALGHYHLWVFPHTPCDCTPSRESPCAGCQLIAKWYACRKVYKRRERPQLEMALSHLDSPDYLARAAERADRIAIASGAEESPGSVFCANCRGAWPCEKKSHLPAWAEPSWVVWRDIKDKVPHESRVKWIGHGTPEASDPKTHPGYYIARDAAAWASEHRGVVWVESVALGEKIAQLAGIEYHGGGPDAEARIKAVSGKKSIVCSISAHGQGTDGLQYKFAKQLLAQHPSGNRRMEQLLGRLHREGQSVDEVSNWWYGHVSELRDSMRRVIRIAGFNHTMSAQMPKILCADGLEDL